MARNFSSKGIILKTTRIGEIHKSVSLFTPELGLINAVAHGAYKGKSKLSGSTDVFSISLFYLYFDPVKNSYKVTDVDRPKALDRIRSDIARFYYASLCAEVIIRTFAGGGEFEATFSLLFEALSMINDAPGEKLKDVLSVFLYKYTEILGYLPEIDTCTKCGASLDDGGSIGFHADGSVLCQRCVDGHAPTINPGARRYLAYTANRSLAESLKIGMDQKTSTGLQNALLTLIQHIIGAPLKSLKGARGIL